MCVCLACSVFGLFLLVSWFQTACFVCEVFGISGGLELVELALSWVLLLLLVSCSIYVSCFVVIAVAAVAIVIVVMVVLLCYGAFLLVIVVYPLVASICVCCRSVVDTVVDVTVASS